jgi:molecular chaperone Hsp33
MSEEEATFGDFVQPFQIEAPGLRGRLVRLGEAIEQVLSAHRYPEPVAVILAEGMAMGAVLSSGLKYDGIFTLQVSGDGPFRLLVVDVTSSGDMRGYARFDAERLADAEGSVARLFGAGQMSFTVDQGPGTERYQGITLLQGATLAECCHAYFRQSEQLETAIRLCASDLSPGAPAPRAAALMLQRLPADDDIGADDDWRRAIVLLSSLTPAELLAPTLSPTDLLYRLFHEDGVRIYRRRPLRFHCRCSETKVRRTLQAFPPEELQTLLLDGLMTVTCEFCKATYTFDEKAIDDMLAAH